MDIIVKNLCKSYDHNQVLDHFSCTFREKKMTCIMGKIRYRKIHAAIDSDGLGEGG